MSALVYAYTGSPLLSALAYLGGFLPQAVGALTLLSLADRLPPRTTMAVWSLVHAGAVALFALGALPVWAMLLVLMVLGLGDAVVGAIGHGGGRHRAGGSMSSVAPCSTWRSARCRSWALRSAARCWPW